MREVGIEISGSKTKALTPEMVERADQAITMGCGAEAEAVCPAGFLEAGGWVLEDPHGKPLRQVRKIQDEIRERVAKFIGEIAPYQEA